MFYEELLEHDLNPFILFDSNGKIKNCNSEAEFLLNFVSADELFNLTLEYASVSFGFNKKFIRLQFEKQTFYAILVGYINEEEIVLRLYKEVTISKPIIIDENFQEANIFTLIELSKSTVLLDKDIQIDEFYDISIPDIKLNINEFLVTINNIFEQLNNISNISIKVYIKTGEYEIIDNKKYTIIAIEFSSKHNIVFDTHQTNTANLNIFFNKNIIRLEIPMII